MIDYTLPLEQLPDPLPIEPLTKPFDVTITPPGSKSITCRAYVLAALAEGESKIIRPLRADDTDRLLDALCTLGAEARWKGEDVYIRGVAGRFPRGGSVNLGDGGTPARFMIAVACLAAEPVIVDGSKRMRERPIAEGVDMLRQLGAKIEYVEEEGRLPVRVVPSDGFQGGSIEVRRTQSSQFISAAMLIAPWLLRGVEIRFSSAPTSVGYVQLTKDVLRHWDDPPTAAVGRSLFEFNASSWPTSTIDGDIEIAYAPRVCTAGFWIDCDASSTVYWIAAALLNRDSNYHVGGIGKRLWQPDLGAIAALMKRAEYPDFSNDELLMGGPKRFTGFEADAGTWPDGSITVAVCASLADGSSRLTGLKTLRVKETDRLAALENELTKVGCTVTTTDDSITIVPPHRRDACATTQAATDPVIIETYNDHRMAMAFAVLGLARPGISIRNPKCVAKSYPGFWKDFAKLYQP
jgi:3-phosphoshikimate 1-carboxyvinyltransferase